MCYIHLECGMYQLFITLRLWYGHLGCFHIQTIVKSIALNIYTQAFVYTPVSICSGACLLVRQQFHGEFVQEVTSCFPLSRTVKSPQVNLLPGQDSDPSWLVKINHQFLYNPKHHHHRHTKKPNQQNPDTKTDYYIKLNIKKRREKYEVEPTDSF